MDDAAAPSAPNIDYPVSAETNLAEDRLSEYYNPAGGSFFAAAPSADLLNLMSKA
jgi:hypothetical protein